MGRRAERVLGHGRLRHLPRAGRRSPTCAASRAGSTRPSALLRPRARRAPALPRHRRAARGDDARRGAEPATVVAARVHGARRPASRPAARFMLALALYEAGAVQEAEAELRAVLERPARRRRPRASRSPRRCSRSGATPRRPTRRSWSTPRAACAADAARRPPSRGWPPATRRAPPAARRTPRTAGLPAGEVALLDAWRAGLAGEAGPRPAPLPAAAAEPLVTMLEALLRVTDVDAFATLVGARRRAARCPAASGASASPGSTCAAASWSPPPTSGSPSSRRARRTPTRSPGSAGSRSAGRCPRMRCCSREEALSLDPGHPAALRILERVHG